MNNSTSTNSISLSDEMKKKMEDLYKRITSYESAMAARKLFQASDEELSKTYRPDDFANLL